MQYTTLNELRVLQNINETNVSKITQTLNQNFEKGLISEELCENSFKELDSLIEKAGNHKYFKRTGTPGNYKYYYTEEEYRQSKGGKIAETVTKEIENASVDIKDIVYKEPISSSNKAFKEGVNVEPEGYNKNGQPIYKKNTVLGTTSSGKEVYSKFDHPGHEGFTKEDHLEAHRLHRVVGRMGQGLEQTIEGNKHFGAYSEMQVAERANRNKN